MSQLIEGGSNLDQKAITTGNRRRFLAGVGVGSVALIGSACTSGGYLFPHCEGPITREDCRLLPRIALAPEADQKAQALMAPILRLMPESHRAVEIYVNPIEPSAQKAWGDSPSNFFVKLSEEGTSIHFIMPGQKIPPQELLEKACYMSALDIFDIYAPGKERLSLRSFFQPNGLNKAEMETMALGRYMEGRASSNWGMPLSRDSAFSSILSVMRFFPEELINRINLIPDLKVRKFIADMGLGSFLKLIERSSIPATNADLPYQADLLANLISVGTT